MEKFMDAGFTAHRTLKEGLSRILVHWHTTFAGMNKSHFVFEIR